MYCFARWPSEFVMRTARCLFYFVQVFGFPLWRNLEVKYSYYCLLHSVWGFKIDSSRMLNDGQRSQIHFTTDYIHYRLSKRYCNQEEMQYFLEGRNTRCVCWLYYLIWLLLIVNSIHHLSSTTADFSIISSLSRNTNKISSRAFQRKNNPIVLESLVTFIFSAY